MKIKILSIVLLAGLITASCKKYDNGPGLSLRSKKERVANTWRIAQVTDDGNDVTDDYESYRLTLTKSGSADLYIRYTFIGGSYEVTTGGTWVFQDKKEQLYLNFDNDDADATYRITKLKEDEMWLRDDADNLEIHLIPQ
ncbi:MAG: hypothetical protein K0S33_399 [Bacteroidetes bacterium]|nr:hypothetical protein [Bacteroidota bacterium]